MSRVQRRHHRQRILNKRRKVSYLQGMNHADRERIARGLINTASPCSCHYCGNPRKYRGNSALARTFKELHAIADLKYVD